MSHTDLLYHIVCGTKDRRPLIAPDWEAELHSYLGGITYGVNGIPITINGIEDHLHLLVRPRPTLAISDFLRELKSESSRMVRKTYSDRFAWGSQYGAFTVSESNAEAVSRYIRNQKAHHARQSYEDEYRNLLGRHKVDADERFLFG